MELNYDSLQVGDAIPDLTSPTISRHVLALFCGASGDHNPIHVDSDFARKFGAPDVFAHGMLSMAFLGQLLTNWVPQSQIRNWNARFISITPIHVKVKCTGTIVDKFEEAGEKRVKLEINAHTDSGQHTLAGQAIIGFN